MFDALVFIALTEEEHLCGSVESDLHIPANAAASSWLRARQSWRLAAFLRGQS